MKTWKHRYLVLDGDNLTLSYYGSKTIYRSKGKPKGSFVFSGAEGVQGKSNHHYGVKLTGHRPGTGYAEFLFCLENEKDKKKWFDVANNAISVKTRQGKKSVGKCVYLIADKFVQVKPRGVHP